MPGGIIPAYAGNTRTSGSRMIGMGDHPRVCGEHKVDDSTGEGAWGSSPRMRGTLRRAFRKFRRLGIIPAYAGNTQPVSPCRQCNRDHPRVCGEHAISPPEICLITGSSPRMRGTLGCHERPCIRLGIIPAYAGNTRTVRAGCRYVGDHPRVCGEHPAAMQAIGEVWGSSPRMRGTLPHSRSWIEHHGIIPAYAGNTSPPMKRTVRARDHPRVCGEHTKRL